MTDVTYGQFFWALSLPSFHFRKEVFNIHAVLYKVFSEKKEKKK